jgi:SNF2 family DNA or RNA helicase
MTSNTTSCLICEKQFDPDELQEFQPVFENDWKLNIVYNKLHKISNVTALSASADSPNHATVPGLPTPRPYATRRRDDGHVCQFDPFRGDGFCTLCWNSHDDCNFMNAKSRCEVCYKMAEICPEDESKSFYLIDKLLKLHQSSPPPPPPQTAIANKPGEGCRRPLKAIVFSQFRKTLDFIGDRLLKRFGAGCIAEYFGSHRKRELRKFACDPACFCLLLTKDGSEGLDLSFVTNIFFLDEIYDKSLREQAVARAWRMGAQGSVKVETLVAKNSIEETMGEMDAVNLSDSFAAAGKAPPEKERRKLLLTSLKLNTDYHYFASCEGNETDRLVPPSATTKRKHIVLVSDDDASVVSSRAKRVRFCLCDDVSC